MIMRDDENPPDLAPPAPPPSLPPTQKLARDIWTDAVLLIILGIALGGAHIGVVSKESFEKALFGVLFILATKIAPKLADALPFMKR